MAFGIEVLKEEKSGVISSETGSEGKLKFSGSCDRNERGISGANL
jgi:hypothetical protein